MTDYEVRALRADGAIAKEVVKASSRAAAVAALTREGLTVLSISEGAVAATGRVSPDDAAIALQQISVMVQAGVDLLEVLDIVASAMASRPIGAHLRAVSAALRQGESFAVALRQHAPFFPSYVPTLVRAGESTGKLALVLAESAKQMRFERRVAKEVQSALTYPAFLVISGVLSVAFLLYAIVPRFAEMLSNARANIEGFSALVINAGTTFHDHAAAIVGGAIGAIALAAMLLQTPDGRRLAQALAGATPGLRELIKARHHSTWASVMALAISSGVNVIEATELSASALPVGPERNRALQAIPLLRSGRPVDECFKRSGVANDIEASLIRAGQRAGALGAMFRAVADRAEEGLHDTIKRLTLIVEPVAIATVAGFIGLIVLGLVSALLSVYESIG